MGVTNHYNACGYLEQIADAVEYSGVPRKVYRKVIAMNARGQVTHEHRGIDNMGVNTAASVSVVYNFSSATGRLLTINSTNSQGGEVQDLMYDWDTVGNLNSREERSGTKNLSESFGYDGLNRLTSQAVAGGGTVTLAYNAIGNILRANN